MATTKRSAVAIPAPVRFVKVPTVVSGHTVVKLHATLRGKDYVRHAQGKFDDNGLREDSRSLLTKLLF